MRIYITGASCAGVTTLGQKLATLLRVRHVDVDDFFWMPTNPPFTTKRPASERVSLIQQKLGHEDWVLTGSCMDWGDALVTRVDLIVFIVTATPVRLERLAAREKKLFGNRIAVAVTCTKYMGIFGSGPRSTTTRISQGATGRGTSCGYQNK
ncbi:hypothetical protein SAMN04490201_3393 [Pseudomonas psychrophila]|uniref:Adenylate kinase n=1 Tax=Pseudomonas psychrophila TaxID=122355 RepID=A0ABY0W2P0_9PSED|nr:hypothetical protein SAMN04490201_3393 [Pseudomonas psychrophila]